MIVKEEIYENGMKFFKKKRFLIWSWWKQFAQAGDLNQPMGNLIDVRFKTYN